MSDHYREWEALKKCDLCMRCGPFSSCVHYRNFVLSLRSAVIEECARACEKRREERFDEHGIRESDTGAAYYSGRDADEYDTRDEEDEDCAAAIRALHTQGKPNEQR